MRAFQGFCRKIEIAVAAYAHSALVERLDGEIAFFAGTAIANQIEILGSGKDVAIQIPTLKKPSFDSDDLAVPLLRIGGDLLKRQGVVLLPSART